MTRNQRKHRSRNDAIGTGLHSNVVEAGERFLTSRPTATAAGTATVIKPDFSGAYWTSEELGYAFASSLMSLPFVKVKGGGRRASAASYWKDIPTGNGRQDFKRGQRYAALTIAAMTADGCAAWYLQKIIEAIVTDAASRKSKGGRYSRTLPPAVDGFIYELSRQFCARITGSER